MLSEKKLKQLEDARGAQVFKLNKPSAEVFDVIRRISDIKNSTDVARENTLSWNVKSDHVSKIRNVLRSFKEVESKMRALAESLDLTVLE